MGPPSKTKLSRDALGESPLVCWLNLIQPLRACSDATVPFRSPIGIALFLPFQNGEKAIFTAERIAQRNGLVFDKQALNTFSLYSIFCYAAIFLMVKSREIHYQIMGGNQPVSLG